MELGAPQIARLLRHRGEMLVLQRLTVKSHNHYTGVVQWSPDSAMLRGHFPGMPIVPGVMLVEAVAQVAGAGMLAGDPYVQSMDPDLIGVLASIRKCTFRRAVLPGQEVVVEVRCRQMTPAAVNVTGVVKVAGDQAADVEILIINSPRSLIEQQLSGGGSAA